MRQVIIALALLIFTILGYALYRNSPFADKSRPGGFDGGSPRYGSIHAN